MLPRQLALTINPKSHSSSLKLKVNSRLTNPLFSSSHPAPVDKPTKPAKADKYTPPVTRSKSKYRSKKKGTNPISPLRHSSPENNNPIETTSRANLSPDSPNKEPNLLIETEPNKNNPDTSANHKFFILTHLNPNQPPPPKPQRPKNKRSRNHPKKLSSLPQDNPESTDMAETPQSMQIDDSCLDQDTESPISGQDTLSTIKELQQQIRELQRQTRYEPPHPDNQQGSSSTNTDPNHEGQTQSQTDWVPKIDYSLLGVDSTSTTPTQTPTQHPTDYTFNQSKTDIVGKLEKLKKSIIHMAKLFHNQQFKAMALERELAPRGDATIPQLHPPSGNGTNTRKMGGNLVRG